MVSKVRTIDFLPEIFKTKTNDQFLSATLDQLIQQPDFRRIQGYIGSKFGYGVSDGDAYLVEPSKIRSNYQLEPAVIFKKQDTDTAVDLITYPGIIDAINLEGGIADNNTSLFENEFYSWDSFVDLDKLINYTKYYWLPDGPDSVAITSELISDNLTYGVISQANTYKFTENDATDETENPTLTLLRGGTYEFSLSQSTTFYIQTMPGISGVNPASASISTREVYGVLFNGTSTGTLTFNVPLSTAQDGYKFPGNVEIDLATTLGFYDINGASLTELNGIDDLLDINGKSLLFVGQPANSETIYIITVTDDIISLASSTTIPDDTNITIKYGKEYANRNFVRNVYGDITIIPIITADLDTLYYQDATNPLKVGVIKLVDASSTSINVDDILGRTTYTSPNGITLTNGLKVQFTGNIIPEHFSNNQYYVEGVGIAIQLIPTTDFIIPEPFGSTTSYPFDMDSYDTYSYANSSYFPYDKDYIIIARNSLTKNAWSRSNRWFHEDVLNLSIEHNRLSPLSSAALGNPENRAKRPIIEFYPNLKLFNAGVIGKPPVDFIDFNTTDAFNEVNGHTTYSPDGASSLLFEGARIIFAADIDADIRRKIYICNFIYLTGEPYPVISLSEAPDGNVLYNDQAVILRGETYAGQTFYYDGVNWIQGQFKNSINQPPKFDILSTSGVSYGDKDFYSGSTFDGCTLFQYAIGTGADDTILKFPIKYSSINNLGDISFEVTLNSQTFSYVENAVSILSNLQNGYVYNYTTRTDYTRKIGWETTVGNSWQYQVFKFTYTQTPAIFELDVAAISTTDTDWPPLVVYVNNERQLPSSFTYTVTSNSTTITLLTTPDINSPIDVMVYSNQTSKLGYYQIPSNLDHNPFNEQISNINLGDIRGHYKSICNNIPNLVGLSFGANNYRDLGDLVPYGTKIIQNSSPLYPAAVFLRNKTANIFDSIQYNSREYEKFKSLLVDTVNRTEFNALQDNASILDSALTEISNSKVESNPFFWSDMIPSKTPSSSTSYLFKSGLTTSVFPLSRIYSFTTANYYSVLIYVTRKIDGLHRMIQLFKDQDYVVSSTTKSVNVSFDLLPDDIVVVKEYSQTYGTYIPNTPTKLGLYPSFKPEVFLDSSYNSPTYFIKGHDGSLTKLYGAYNNGYLQDYRDRALFEFELRIFNNLKVDAKLPIEYDDIFPGQFRTTTFDRTQIQQMYSTTFLNWVGLNRIDYQTQFYENTNEFTWNYNQSSNKLNSSTINQGNWRGVYMWLYDTATPDTTPWEMLGLTIKPLWWETRYGEAPYTSDNTLLWQDLSNGYVYNNGNSFINEKRVRPDLLKVLPVDEYGNLVSPFTSFVAGYKSETFKNSWIAGDLGPAEYSYQKSSTWPFDLMRLCLLVKPANFFALGLNLDTYKYNTEFKQYLVNNRSRITPNDIVVYGTNDTTATHSYLNWVVDYARQYGLDGSSIVYTALQNLDVRLTYRMAGFSDKDLLKFFIEKGSASDATSSLLIPDESYSVLLYDNQPNDAILFSSVIIQKTDLGYKIYGNGQNKAFFTALYPLNNGNYNTIVVNDITVTVPKDFKTTSYIIPYGTEFTDVAVLSNFLKGYGKYLENQGMVFDDIENGLELNWDQMIAETLYWIQSGWEVGSTVNVNPCANIIQINKESNIVQPLTIQQQNYILNQNLIPIQIKDLSIYRKDTFFSAKALNPGDSLSFFTGNMSNIEHVVVFDNVTSFNDILMNLVTSLRQQRFFVKGTKTAEWNGTMNAAGFIINQNNIEEWQQNVKYTKGTIVKYKNKYYAAQAILQPSIKFDTSLWLETSYDKIQQGLLPNASNRAYESTLYYDINQTNLESDGDLLGFSLIGYRPRKYLADADLDDITQVNVYKNFIEGKGTNQTVSGLNGISVHNNTFSYSIHENWAIKTSEFGGLMNQNFIEFTLNQNDLVGNPSIVSIIKDVNVTGSQQQIPLYQVKNYGKSISTVDILSTTSGQELDKFPTAGYVNLDDIRAAGYTIDRLSNSIAVDVYQGDYIWIADKDNSWNVFSMLPMEAALTTVYNNLNGTITLDFDKSHYLSIGDAFGIVNFSGLINGYYTVVDVPDIQSVIVSLTLSASITSLTGTGLYFKLQTQRISKAKDIQYLPVISNQYIPYKVWVDQNVNGNWTVYEKTNNYTELAFDGPLSGKVEYGTGVANVPNVGYFVSDPGEQKMYHYRNLNGNILQLADIEPIGITTTRYGTAITHNDKFLIVSDSNPEAVLVTSNIGLTLSSATVISSTYFIVNGNKLSSLSAGDSIAFDGYETVYTVFNSTYNSGTNKTTFDTIEPITDTVSSGTIVFTNGLSYLFIYKIVSDINIQTLVLEQVESIKGSTLGNAMAISGDSNFLYANLLDYGLVAPYQLDNDYTYTDVGLTLASATVIGAKYFVVDGDKVSYLDIGKSIAFDDAGYETVYTIITGEYDSGEDTTTFYTVEEINYSISSGTTVFTASYHFSLIYVQVEGTDVPDLLTYGDDPAGDQFGFSLATNYDGSKLFIGAPKYDFDEANQNSGIVYLFDRLVCNIDLSYDGIAGGFILINLPYTFNSSSIVFVNGERVTPGKYILFINLLILSQTGIYAGDIITVSSGNFVVAQQITSYENETQIRPGELFGFSLDCTTTGSELLVGSPYDIHSTTSEGAVYRYTNGGKRFGVITGLIGVNVTEVFDILINGFTVVIPIGNATTTANAINSANITNVIAYATADNRLIVRLRDVNLNPLNDKLNLSTFNGNDLYALGLTDYGIKTQIITDPRQQTKSQFGYAVKFNQYNSFVVSAPTNTRYLNTTFDYTADANFHNDTTFDYGMTRFEDTLVRSGSVYMYDYITSYGESLTENDIGKYIYAQSCNDIDTDTGYLPYYGTSLAFTDYTVLIGTPRFKPDTAGGKINIFENSLNKQNWSVYREYSKVVDINRIQKVQLYNNTTNESIDSLDYIDPLQGKLLGAVRQNLDFISGQDPSGYNSPNYSKGNIVWGKSYVGKMWFNFSTMKFMNYHQGDVAYDSQYWGAPFPGSTVTVYTWVESDVTPVNYTGTGTPYDIAKYTIEFRNDANNNSVARYYYWVRNTNVLHNEIGKTLTDTVIEQYITDPQSSGIAYFTPLKSNTFAIYNASEYIGGTTTNLHLGFSSGDSDSTSHVEFKLLRTDYPDDFLPGTPSAYFNNTTPTGLYDRMLDSLSGTDESGAIVPDPYLPKMIQTGIGVRPRQSFFINRFKALENYLKYANQILSTYPISEYENPTFLSTSGDYYNTADYWNYVYWWADGYNNTTKTSLEVPYYGDLSTIETFDGLLVGVLENGQGKREVYLYKNSTWTRVGLQDGTIEFSDKLWDYQTNKIGFGDSYFDSVPFDQYPSVETRNIIRALNEQIYINNLLEYRNKSLIILFEYIQSENIESNNYMPWLNKTSFVDIQYLARKLLPYTQYQQDNQSLLEGYVNEVKPYHVVIKEFTLKYTGEDQYDTFVSDFDLPATYFGNGSKFISPQLVQSSPSGDSEFLSTSSVWWKPEYLDWYINYGLTFEATENNLVATLLNYLDPNSTEIILDNAYGLPTAGTIKINDEYIGYTTVNRDRSTLHGLSRGINNTLPIIHSVGSSVYIDIPAVIIVDSGRGYTDVPNVSVYIDTSKYPAPKTPAVLKAVLGDNRVIDVQVINPGSGYVTQPTIVFDYSYSITFNYTSIDVLTNTISLAPTDFIEGDLVKVTASGVTNRIIEPGYYYIHFISNNPIDIIALYKTRADALIDQHRVSFNSGYVPSSGGITVATYTIGISAYAVPNLAGNKVRTTIETLRYDRTSYQPKVTLWEAGHFYSSPYVSIGNDSSSPISMYYSTPKTITVSSGWVTPSGGTGAVFTVYNVLLGGNYYVDIVDGGTGFDAGDVIVIPGTQLSGTSPANDCTITVATVDTGEILTIDPVTGDAVDAYVAGLQGVVLPILSAEPDTNGNALVLFDYAPSNLYPGQIKDARLFFYRIDAPYTYDDSGSSGAIIEIYKPRFDPSNVTKQYTIKVIDQGSIYNDGDQIIIQGALLGGVTGTNDAIINIQFVTAGNGIYIASVTGIAVVLSSEYYVDPLDEEKQQLYSDASLLSPVQYIAFPFTTGDYAYIPEPLTSGISYGSNTTSMVVFNGEIYACIQSNNDSTFNLSKWELLQSDDRRINALDRITAYYQPTFDMPAKEMQRLLSGVTYPNPVYYGNSFAPEEVLPLDIELRDEYFYTRDLNFVSIIYDGSKYIALGNGLDYTLLLISDDYGSTWEPAKLSTQPLGATSIKFTGNEYIITTTNTNMPVLISYDAYNWVATGEVATFDSTGFGVTNYDSTSLNCPAIPLQKSEFLNDISLLVGTSILRSYDGVIWNTVYQSPSKFVNVYYDIKYFDINNFDGYIVVGRSDQITAGAGTANPTIETFSAILLSTDGINWDTILPSLTPNILYTVSASSTIMITAGENATIYYGVNGSNWTSATISGSPITDTIRSSVYSNGKFVLVGDSGTILVSSNGMTYTQITSSSITTSDLSQVIFDGSRFVAVGTNNTIIRSSDGITWSTVSTTTNGNLNYSIVGDDFLHGYGPEELVPGIVSDNLSLKVITSPGSYWDNDNITQDFWYYHTGFSMLTKTGKLDTNNQFSFDGVAVNSAQLAVFIIDDSSHISRRIYENTSVNNPTYYSIDWINKLITIQGTSLASTESLFVEVYEVGNGRQIERSNSQDTPLRIDADTGNSTFILVADYQEITTDPIVFVNGTKLEYNVDYTIPTNLSYLKILFNTVYDPSIHYITFAILATSITDYNPSTEYGYSIPETEVFLGDVIDGYEFVTTLNLDGDNPANLIVEVNGERLVPPGLTGSDYTVNAGTGTITLTALGPLTADDLVSITAFNETGRQWLKTVLKPNIMVSAITYVYNTIPTKIVVDYNLGEFPDNQYQTYNDGDEITIDGLLGSTGLNNTSCFVKDVTNTTNPDPLTWTYEYELYSDVTLYNPLNGYDIGVYTGGGFSWLTVSTIEIPSPTVPAPMPNIEYIDATRTWVTIENTASMPGHFGRRVSSDMLRFNTGNKLSILAPINYGENIIVTAFVTGETPNETKFNMNIDRYGMAEVYRTNLQNGTWITEEILAETDIIYLNNASRVVSTVSQNTDIVSSGDYLVSYLEYNISEIKGISIYDNNNLVVISSSNYEMQQFNGRSAVVFSDGVVAGLNLTITMQIGNIVEINGERIYFTSIDLVTNTLTGLIRGVQGTPTIDHAIYDQAFGINAVNKLKDFYYNKNWNSSVYNVENGDPLQISTTPAALFLLG
jgi:hypothetical protein